MSILDRIAAFARWALRRPKPEARQVPRAESLTALEAATYLRRYAEAYRREYDVFTQRPPVGGGYPKLPVSPYLNSSEILCYLTPDGVVVADHSWQPDYEWYIAGGPAMMVDFPETRTPREVTELLQAEGILGKEIGIYRIVATGGVPSEMWNGDLGATVETAEQTLGSTKIVVRRFDLDCKTLVQRLTYGALGFIIDFKIAPQESDYWIPQIIRDLGFLTADRKGRRFYHYMEVLPHVTAGAWDPKAIAVRVRVDVRRDFAFAFSLGGKPGGTITFGSSSAQEFLVEHSRNRGRFLAGLSRLERILNEFVELLEVNRDEKAFQEFLTANAVLLDVYAEASFPKERLQYPTGESPLGKAYVEPDFIVRLPGNLYRLVELESPSKKIATEHGETRAGVNQAAFQIGEWRTYIQKHYDLLKGKFPGIAVNQTSMVVISRSTQSSFGNGRDMRSYMELVRNTLKVDEVLTYDDLLGRARQAYAMLSTLGESG